MLFHIFLMALVVSSFVAESAKFEDANPPKIGFSSAEQKATVVASSVATGTKLQADNPSVAGHSMGEQKVLTQPIAAHRGNALRGTGTVLAAQPAEPAAHGASPGGRAAPGHAGEDAKTGVKLHMNMLERVITQLVFGLIYYFLIVSKYPELKDTQPSSLAVEVQKENEVVATFCGKVSLRNCCLSWCCSGSRAAHTFHSVGLLNFWPSVVLMSVVPCCTLWYMNSQTDLNEKVGGERRDLCMGCLCACCCSCCVIAQDAEALDLTMGVQTGCCGVYENPRD